MNDQAEVGASKNDVKIKNKSKELRSVEHQLFKSQNLTTEEKLEVIKFS